MLSNLLKMSWFLYLYFFFLSANPKIHSFNQQIYTDHLRHTKLYIRHWEHNPDPQGTYILEGETDNN